MSDPITGIPESLAAGSPTRAARMKASRIMYRASCILTVIFLLCLVAFPANGQVAQKKSSLSLEKRIMDLEKEVAFLRGQVDVYAVSHLPETLMLCDKKVPLFRDDVRERFEREFFQFLQNKGLMVILVKRCLKYQPFINGELQKAGLPADLIYLALAESYLNPRAVSSASAAGLWQFIKETGKKEGLYVDDHVDERYNSVKATRSALAHLKRLHNEFGDWLIAMAAYNAGSARLREAIENQETRDFFDLLLPEETERYLFRILSIKEILTNREQYGIQLGERDLYRPYSVSQVTLDLSRETHTNILARSMDLPYKAFRDLNLHLRKYRLPKGVYSVYVPSDKLSGFLNRLQAHVHIAVLRETPHREP